MHHSPMAHHPDTAFAFRLHPLTKAQLQQAYQRSELAPYQSFARFGVQNAEALRIYLASPQAKLVNSIVMDRILAMLEEKAEFAFEAKEHAALNRRMLAFLIMRYLAQKHHKQQLSLEAQKLLEEELHHSPERAEEAYEPPNIAFDVQLTYEEMEFLLQAALEYDKTYQRELDLQFKKTKHLEEDLEKTLKNLFDPAAWENAAEKVADFFMAFALQFSEQLDDSVSDLESEMDRIHKNQHRKNNMPTPKPDLLRTATATSEQLHQLRQRQEEQRKTLDQMHQLRDKVQASLKQIEQQPMRSTASQQLHSVLQTSTQQFLNIVQHHLKYIEQQQQTHVKRLGRFSMERAQLSEERVSIASRYGALAQSTRARLSPSPSRPTETPHSKHASTPTPKPKGL